MAKGDRNVPSVQNAASGLLVKTVAAIVLLVAMIVMIAAHVAAATVIVVATVIVHHPLTAVVIAIGDHLPTVIADQLQIATVAVIATNVTVVHLPIVIADRLLIVTVAVIATNAGVIAATASSQLSSRELNGKRLAFARRFSFGPRLSGSIGIAVGRQHRTGLA